MDATALDLASLREFLKVNADTRKYVEAFGREAKAAYSHAVLGVVQANAPRSEGADLVLAATALKVLRLVMREREEVAMLHSDDALQCYVSFAENWQQGAGADSGSAGGAAAVAAARAAGVDTAQMEGLRCIINSTVQNPPVIARFIAAPTNGLHALVALLRAPGPADALALVARILHHVSGTDKAVMKTLVEELDIVETVVVTLAAVVRTKEPRPFPHGHGRVSLADFLLKLLFSLASEYAKLAEAPGEGAPAAAHEMAKHFTQLGVLILEVLLLNPTALRLPPAEGDAVWDLRQTVVELMMFMPPDYAHFLAANGGLDPIVDLLARQVAHVHLRYSTAHPAKLLTPAMIVLNNCCGRNPRALDQVKERVWPAADDVRFKLEDAERRRKLAEREAELRREEDEALAAAGLTREQADARDKAALAARLENPSTKEAVEGRRAMRVEAYQKAEQERRVHPENAPKGTFRAMLLRQMCSLDYTVKRYAAELMFTLCKSNAEEFTRRTGFGNAIALLRLKGIIDTPGIDKQLAEQEKAQTAKAAQ